MCLVAAILPAFAPLFSVSRWSTSQLWSMTKAEPATVIKVITAAVIVVAPARVE